MEKQNQQGLYSPSHEHDSCGVGMIVHLKGLKSHEIVSQSLQALENLEHRGACGCEKNTGDGAGILIQIPHDFFSEEVQKLNFKLPHPGEYGTGLVFLPQNAEDRKQVKTLFEKIIRDQNQTCLGWRLVPTNDVLLGKTARDAMPHIEQIFIGLGTTGANLSGSKDWAFERRLFIIRKTFENEINKLKITSQNLVYLPSLSSKTFIYKGMFISYQVRQYFPDLQNQKVVSALALVHSRFSTNTFPNWELAHPFRYICHNGEINTLRGNINWMRAREAMLASPLLGDELKKVLPVIREGGSDSAIFDNVLEMLVMGGYSLPHAVMMMIPEAWAGHATMSPEKKDFYRYHSCLMEPWDGPALIAFSDGETIGAVLDRNGLRPARYYVTRNDWVVMASEVGVLDIKPEDVLVKGRLEPGKMFLIDLKKGRIVDDSEIKHQLATAHPYGDWLSRHLVQLEDIPPSPAIKQPDQESLRHRQMLFGYTREDLSILMTPMAVDGIEALGSMGNDTPLAVLTERPQLLYSYFKQLFAQVTNPPLDALREELVTSVETTIGSEGNLFLPEPKSCHQIELHNPIIDNDDLVKLKNLEHKPYRDFYSQTISMLFDVKEGFKGFQKTLDEVFVKADQAIASGSNILILSDRGAHEGMMPLPCLLVTAGLHNHLVRNGTRAKVGLVIESGEPREVHHFCLLIGFGAGAINPYLAFESLDDLIADQVLNLPHKKVLENYIKAVKKGVVKVMSKMGISTIQSYRGAQIFEAIGLNRSLIDAYFTHTASRIEGIGLEEVYEEAFQRHARAYPQRIAGTPLLENDGSYQWRQTGAFHLFNPDTIAKLQHATKLNDYSIYKEYASLVNDQSKNLCTLRGLMKFKKGNPVPLFEVESAAEIVHRFKTGAMSYGSISQEAHETLAIAMNRMGGKSNTGEGGEDSGRYVPLPNGDSKNSAIKQVASGRFGVTSEYLVQAKELQIKIAQGAKPGEGGQLPGKKVYPWIAKVRYATPGVGLISPPPHHDIYSIEDLAQLIFDLKNSNPRAKISVKLVSEVGVGTVAAGVSKAHSDVVVIAGHDGGTGASPLTSIKHAGVPWELGLAETQQTLVRNNLRDRIVVEVDGQLKTGRDVAIAALLGGEEFGFATAPLVTLGCIMMRVCHLDTCPVGVATQNPKLREKFSGQPEYVIRFFMFLAEELRNIMAELGFRNMDEMIGRSDLLDFNGMIAHWKSRGLDFSSIFYRPQVPHALRCVATQDHGLAGVLDYDLIEKSGDALKNKKPVRFSSTICNRNRTAGTLLGSELTRLYGATGLPDDTLWIDFHGSAGQSFGAFLPKGITLNLVGDANDYVGKGLSGGKVIVSPSPKSSFKPEENILVGNVVLYGATSGQAFFKGIAGERFCVRNSGAHAVIEGVGDHGCEYMTGGRVIVLGKTGRNFAAGMSGGLAYVFDPHQNFSIHCNQEMVALEKLDGEDYIYLKEMIELHRQYTQSSVAISILQSFETQKTHFVKVFPIDYKKALVEIHEKMNRLGISEREAMYG